MIIYDKDLLDDIARYRGYIGYSVDIIVAVDSATIKNGRPRVGAKLEDVYNAAFPMSRPDVDDWLHRFERAGLVDVCPGEFDKRLVVYPTNMLGVLISDHNRVIEKRLKAKNDSTCNCPPTCYRMERDKWRSEHAC